MLDSVQEDIMSNVAWIMKNFKTSVHDPRILSYSVEACSTKPWNLVQSSDSFFFQSNGPVGVTGLAAHDSPDEQIARKAPASLHTRSKMPSNFPLFRYDQSTFQAAIWAEYGWPETTVGAWICFPFWSAVTTSVMNLLDVLLAKVERVRGTHMTRSDTTVEQEVSSRHLGSEPTESNACNCWLFIAHSSPRFLAFQLPGLSDSRVMQNLFHLIEKLDAQICRWRTVMMLVIIVSTVSMATMVMLWSWWWCDVMTHTQTCTHVYIYVYYSGDHDDDGTGTFEEVNLEPGLFAVACFVGIRVSPHRCYQLHLRYRRLSAPLQSMLVELIYSIMKAGAQWVVSSRPHDASKLCDHQTSCQPQPILGSLFGCWGM